MLNEPLLITHECTDDVHGEQLPGGAYPEPDELLLLCRPWSMHRELLLGTFGAIAVHSLALLLLMAGPGLFPRAVSEGPEYTVRLVALADGPAQLDPRTERGGSGDSDALPDASAESNELERGEATGKLQDPQPPEPNSPQAGTLWTLPDKPAKPVEMKAVVKKAETVLPKKHTNSPKASLAPRERQRTATNASDSQESPPAGSGSPPSHDFESPDALQGLGRGPGGQGGAASGSSPVGLGQLPATREFQLAEVDKPPELVNRVEPDYPIMARRQRLTGRVVVKLLVDPHGQVRKASVLQAAPQGVFESCVLEAVERWRFKPGYYRGQPVSTWVVLPIQFKVSG